MTLRSCEALRIDGSGNLSTAYVTIDDDDDSLASQEPGTIYAINGVALAPAPVVDFGDISGTALDGSALSTAMTHFNDGKGFDYYLLESDIAPQEFATVTATSFGGIVGGFPYLNKSLSLDGERLFVGQALQVTFDNTTGVTGQGLADLIVSDDDTRIQFNGQNGAANSEAGVGAQVVLGTDRFVTDFNVTNGGAGDTQMVLVNVTCQTTSGLITFEALRFTQPIFNGAFVYYLPRNGSVDLATVQTYVSETLLAGSADGLTYDEFGLGGVRHLTIGNGLANYLHGNMLHDELVGRNGADSLVGGLGSDLLNGGNGDDFLFGGAHRDVLTGGAGNDRLSGGIDNDRVSGDAGRDLLFGGFGDDSLSGGADNDTLSAAEGNDTLTGGLGQDQLGGGTGNDVLDGGAGEDALRGNTGADRFVFKADGATDRLLDFRNGQDHIDLTETFASLVITTVSPGTVHIQHSGELLIVTDLAGTLTAAAFTAADFV